MSIFIDETPKLLDGGRYLARGEYRSLEPTENGGLKYQDRGQDYAAETLLELAAMVAFSRVGKKEFYVTKLWRERPVTEEERLGFATLLAAH